MDELADMILRLLNAYQGWTEPEGEAMPDGSVNDALVTEATNLLKIYHPAWKTIDAS